MPLGQSQSWDLEDTMKPLFLRLLLNEGVKLYISILIISNHITVRTTALRAMCHQETLLDSGNGYELCWGKTPSDP